MTERLADITARIENVRQLDSVVKAMRAIAATRARESRGLLPAIEAYAATMAQGIGEALGFLPEPPAPMRGAGPGGHALVLFCAEQGFAGAFSDRVLDAAGDAAAGAHLMLVGTRGGAVAAERGLVPAWRAAMASKVSGVPMLANRLADALYARTVDGSVTRVDLLFPAIVADRSIRVQRKALFPLDLPRFRIPPRGTPPIATLDPALLLERLTAEYVFARLCEAAMQAFAAENQARLEAMSAASTNIGRALEELRGRENQIRQEEVTAEIIELAAGAESVDG